MFLGNPQKSLVNVFLIKNVKKHCHKKVIVCFYNFRWRKFLKVTAYVTSIMPLFEIYHFLKELRVSFNVGHIVDLTALSRMKLYFKSI